MNLIHKRRKTTAKNIVNGARKLIETGTTWVYGTGKVDDKEYHSLPYLSSHVIKELADKNNSDYYLWRKFVKRDVDEPERKRIFDVGTAAHTLVLEPKLYEANTAVQPEEIKVRRGKKWDEFEAENKGKSIITIEQDKNIRLLANSVRRNSYARAILKDCKSEVTGLTRLESGCLLRGRIDAVNFAEGYGADLKTCEDVSPAEFAKAAARYRYDLQAFTYKLLFGLDEFVFICTTKTDPIELAIYTLNDEFMEKAEEDYNGAVERWQRINKPTIPESWITEDDPIRQLAPPKWFFYD